MIFIGGAFDTVLNSASAVLKICSLRKIFCALAATAMIVLQSAGVAGAADWYIDSFTMQTTPIRHEGKLYLKALLLAEANMTLTQGIEIEGFNENRESDFALSNGATVTSGDGETTGTVIKDFGNFLFFNGTHKGDITLASQNARLQMFSREGESVVDGDVVSNGGTIVAGFNAFIRSSLTLNDDAALYIYEGALTVDANVAVNSGYIVLGKNDTSGSLVLNDINKNIILNNTDADKIGIVSRGLDGTVINKIYGDVALDSATLQLDGGNLTIHQSKKYLEDRELPTELGNISITGNTILSFSENTSLTAAHFKIFDRNTIDATHAQITVDKLEVIDDSHVAGDLEWTGGSLSLSGTKEGEFLNAKNLIVDKTQLEFTGTEKYTSNANLYLQESTLSIAQGNWALNNINAKNNSVISITGGTLKTPQFNLNDSSKLRLNGGTLSTLSGSIFANSVMGSHNDGKQKTTGGVNNDLSGKFFFDSGLIIFEDEKYNTAYAIDAVKALHKFTNENITDVTDKKQDALSPDNIREIVFSGTLVSSPPPLPPSKPDEDIKPEIKPEVPVNGLNPDTINDIISNITGGDSDKAPTAPVFAHETLKPTTTGKDLVIGATAASDAGEGFADADIIKGSMGSKDIELNENSSQVQIMGSQYYTLVGATKDTQLVTGTTGDVVIHVGNTALGEAGDGTLNLGVQGLASGGTLKGTIVLDQKGSDDQKGGTLNVRAGEFSTTAGVENNGGTVNIQANATLNSSLTQTEGTSTVKGILKAEKASLSGGKFHVAGIADITKLTGGTDTQITVGSTEGGAGILFAQEAQLKGASLFTDPAWKGNDEISGSSKVILNFTHGIDGLLTAGQNSFMVLGDTDTAWAEKVFKNSGLKWGKEDISAALFIRSSQTFDATGKGGILVDGSITKDIFDNSTEGKKAKANEVVFADKSLLVVDASAMTQQAALVGNEKVNTLVVNAGSKLLITNGKVGGRVNIASGFSTVSNNSWTENNKKNAIVTDSSLLQVDTVTNNAGTGENMSVTLKQVRAQDAYKGIAFSSSLYGIIDNLALMGIDTNAAAGGHRFLSRATSSSFVADKQEQATTIESAARAAFVGAVPHMALGIAGSAAAVATSRTSFASPAQGGVVAYSASGSWAQAGLSAGDRLHDGLGVWLMPTYQHQKGFGFAVGNFESGYRSSLGGIALGADYTVDEAFRLGASFTVGAGYAASTGDFNTSHNQLTYWGLGLYAGYVAHNIGITADLGYSLTDNDMTQILPQSMAMGNLKGQTSAATLTAGLRSEYRLTLDHVNVLPHAGVRILSTRVQGLDMQAEGKTVLHGDESSTTIWQFPVGVSFAYTAEMTSGWQLSPSLDLALVPAAGDLKAKNEVHFTGVAGRAAMESPIMDALLYRSAVGLSMKKDDLSVDFSYTYQGSQHTADHGLQAVFRYEF